MNYSTSVASRQGMRLRLFCAVSIQRCLILLAMLEGGCAVVLFCIEPPLLDVAAAVHFNARLASRSDTCQFSANISPSPISCAHRANAALLANTLTNSEYVFRHFNNPKERAMPQPDCGLRKFIGQQKEVMKLQRQIAGAKTCSEPLPPMLIIGPSGIGKTYLVKCLAEEVGTSLIRAHGKESEPTLVGKLRRVKHGDIVLIDEAHNLSPEAQEMIYEVIDNSQVPEGDGTESEDEMIYLEIPSCTVLLATNQPGKLLDAMQKRMEFTINLGYYPLNEMQEIADHLAAKLNMFVSLQASKLIAKVSGGLPRCAKHHLKNLRRHCPNAQGREIRCVQVRDYLATFQIDDQGLGPQELDYMRYLQKVNKASLESIRLHLGLDVNHVRQQIEARLQRLGFITLSGGRELTQAGRMWLAKSHDSETR